MKSYIKITKGITEIILEVDYLKVTRPPKYGMHQNIKYSGVLIDIHSEYKPYYHGSNNFNAVLGFLSDKLRVKRTRMGYSFTLVGHSPRPSSIDRGVTATHIEELSDEQKDNCVHSLMYLLQ